jgi:hypothetical protein
MTEPPLNDGAADAAGSQDQGQRIGVMSAALVWLSGLPRLVSEEAQWLTSS